MSGYEKSPDYGGSEVTKWTIVKLAIFVVGLSILFVYLTTFLH